MDWYNERLGFRQRLPFSFLLLVGLVTSTASQAFIIEPNEDVMTSSFFTGADLVRGYAGDARPVMRVSTDGAFGLTGGETIYIDFSSYEFSTVVGPVSATLTVQSVPGGFGADADQGSPFTVSAHALSADPFVVITDDTNPGGGIDWLSFYETQIQPSDLEARTKVDGFGAIEFDVSGIVNAWILGLNSTQVIALSGLDDASGMDFLHGFQNASEAPGSTFLSVSPIPEPGTGTLMLIGLTLLGATNERIGRRRPRCNRSLRKSLDRDFMRSSHEALDGSVPNQGASSCVA